MARTKKQSTEAAVREIRRRTRRKFALATGIGTAPLTFVYTSYGSLVSFRPEITLTIGALMVTLFFLFPRWIERRDLFGLARHFRHPEDAA